MVSRTLIVSATALLAACTPAIMKTPVSGMPTATARLVGEWHGDYSGIESGRHGTIAFLLRAGADTAEGDVIMEAGGESDPSAPNAPASWDALRATHQPLSIRFVFVSNDEVSGALNPYRDPNCGCTLTTTFRGTLRGDVIEGTFRSEGDGFHHLPQSGRWRVKRSAR
jgi:hypothetical protein